MKKWNRITTGMIILSMAASLMGCGAQDGVMQSSNQSTSQKDFSEVVSMYGSETEDYYSWSEEQVSLYSNKYYDYFWGKDSYSLDELYEVVEQNKSVPKDKKEFVKDYITTLYSYYPNLEWRNFVNNYNDVKWEERDADDPDLGYGKIAGSYLVSSNVLIVRKDIDLENDELSQVVLRHEIGHMFGSSKFENGNVKAGFKFCSCTDGTRGTAVMEGMDVILTVDPYLSEYKADNFSYSIIVNSLRVVLDSIDYSPADMSSHNIEYFEKKIDDCNVGDLTGREFTDDCDILLDGMLTESIEDGMPELNKLYKFVADLYIDHNLNSGMTDAQVMEQEKELEKRMTLGCPHPEYVYTQIFEEEFSNYLSNR